MGSSIDSRDVQIRELYEQHADEIFRFALMMLNDYGAARDAVQEVFLRVVRRWDAFRHESSPRTWLWRITQNYVTDVLRRKRKLRFYLVREVPESPDSHLSGSALEFQALIAHLPLLQRQVLVLRFWNDLSMKEIAALLEWPETRVRNTVYRALKALRTTLSEEETERGLQRDRAKTP